MYSFTKEERTSLKGYTIFYGVRNPVESLFSLFQKRLTNHDDYLNPTLHRSNWGWIGRKQLREFRCAQESKSFQKFVLQLHKTPFINVSLIYKQDPSYKVVRFESLHQDFENVIPEFHGYQLPRVNATRKNQKGYLEDLSDPIFRKKLLNIVWPFMLEWWYVAPFSIEELQTVSRFAKFRFRINLFLFTTKKRLASYLYRQFPFPSLAPFVN